MRGYRFKSFMRHRWYLRVCQLVFRFKKMYNQSTFITLIIFVIYILRNTIIQLMGNHVLTIWTKPVFQHIGRLSVLRFWVPGSNSTEKLDQTEFREGQGSHLWIMLYVTLQKKSTSTSIILKYIQKNAQKIASILLNTSYCPSNISPSGPK